MIQPEALKKTEPLLWATGTGTDVWELFGACIAGSLETVKRLLAKDPSLVNTQYAYRTPIYFAVRENRVDIATFLLDHGSDPLGLAVNDSLLQIARDRGYAKMEKVLEEKLAQLHGASPKGEAVAAAIRERDVAKVTALLDAAPELLHAGDGRGNQPIHWATMMRQLDVIDLLFAGSRNQLRGGRTVRDPFSSRMAIIISAAGAMCPTTGLPLPHRCSPTCVLAAPTWTFARPRGSAIWIE